MIGSLRGNVTQFGEHHIILDVRDVGYLVYVSNATMDWLRTQQDSVLLHIETHVREDHIHLYGFTSAEEKALCNMLTTVQGVGAKMGLAILSVFPPRDIIDIITAQDHASLTRVNGIGKRLAERIITELKNKLPSLPAGAHQAETTQHVTGSAGTAHAATEDAVSALEHLGYARIDALRAIQQVEHDADDSLDTLIRLALQQLSQ